MNRPVKIWQPASSPEPDLVLELQREIGVSKSLATLMAQRGICSYEEARIYFNPGLDQLHDPFLMKDMGQAVKRIGDALANEEPILFYGDYDVDGTTSVSLMVLYFREFYPNIHFYVPDRQTEGYGISRQGVEFAADNGFTLVVALDCGIKAIDTIAYAKDLGVDFIVCDHHNPGDTLPDAVAVLDPKRKDCIYPYKELCGCGVGFKLICAIHEKLSPNAPSPYQYIDLVAVGIASDIVPITGENRLIAYEGLRKLNTSPTAGLASMIRVIGFKGKYTINDVVFKIGPRINAAGRLRHAQYAVELLIGNHKDKGDELAAEINQINTDRRTVEKAITQECMSLLENDENSENNVTTVLYGEHWHKGVIGIVASKLIERFYRPTIVLTKSGEDVATGSARSVEGFNLYEALVASSDLLEQFGGHAAAAGMTLKIENIPAFRKAFDKAVAERITSDLLTPKVPFDLELSPADLNWKFFNSISRLGPFGPENHRPRFVTRNVVLRKPRALSNEHLKFSLFTGAQYIDCIAFGNGHWLEEAQLEKAFDLCYCIDVNEWQGNTLLQLDIKDLKLAEV